VYALKHPTKERGMTLIEVLLAIVIFAIGLLGVAALQVAGLRYTKGSQNRSLAIIQAENITERMRANPAAVADGKYVTPDVSETLPDCLTTECTPAQMAEYDLATWLSDTRQALGAKRYDGALNTDSNVNATVCIDSTPEDGTNGTWACDGNGNIYAIKIEWLERTTSREGKLADNYSSSGSASSVEGFVVNRFVLRFVP